MGKLIDMYKKMGVAAKAGIWFVFCNLMTKGISTITVPIFTRLLTTEEYGTYSIYLSWLNIFTIITSLNLYYGAYNNALNKYRDEATCSRYIASMQGITTSLVVGLALIYAINIDFWNEVIGLPTPIMCLMLIELFVAPATLFWSGRQRFEYHYKKMVGVTLLKSALNPILGLIFVLTWDAHHEMARILGIAISEVCISGSILIFQFYKGKTFFDKKFWKYALSFNIPLLPHYLSGTILNQGDRIMIQKMVGRGEVAIYSIAYNIGMLIQIFTNAINNAMTPWMYERLNEKDFKAIQKNVTYILLGLAMVIVVLIFFAPEVVLLFGSKKYADAVYVVPPVAASVFFIFLFNVFAIPQMYFEDKRFMPIASMSAAALNLVLNFIFIQIYGYYAAGYTTLVCYIIYSLGHYYFSKKVCEKHLSGINLFETRKIVHISIFLVACSIVFNLLYKFTLLRYALGVLLIVILLTQKKKVVGVIREIKKK